MEYLIEVGEKFFFYLLPVDVVANLNREAMTIEDATWSGLREI